MKSLKSGLIVLGSVGLLFLGACGKKKKQEANSNSSPATSQDKTAAKTETSEKQHGGQVVESGPYHLEFVPEKGANGAHLDLYVLKGDNHEPIPDAKVTAQVQTPLWIRPKSNSSRLLSSLHLPTRPLRLHLISRLLSIRQFLFPFLTYWVSLTLP